MMNTQSFMIDSMIFDELYLDEEAVEAISSLLTSKKIEIFVTSVQLNQLDKIPDAIKKEKISKIINHLSPRILSVEYAPWGYAWGECWGGISPDCILDTADFVTSKQHVTDAMIAATASSDKYDLDYIVTNDGKFRKRIKRQNISIKVINYCEFKKKLDENRN